MADKTIKERVEAFAVGVEDLRKREVRSLNKAEMDLCPLCGNADVPDQCTCLVKSFTPKMPAMVKPPKTPGMQPATPAVPVPGSHGKPAGMAKDEMCKSCGKAGDLCKCMGSMKKDEMPGAAKPTAAPAKPTLPGKKIGTPVASPYTQHAKRAKDLSGAIMGIHRDATAVEHQAAADAHSIAAKHAGDAKTQNMHLQASRTHQAWAAHKTVPAAVTPVPTMKSEDLVKAGLQSTVPGLSPAAGLRGTPVATLRANVKAKQAMPLADLQSVANPTAPHQSPGLPGMTPKLPSMEGFKSDVQQAPAALPSMSGFKSDATSPTAMPGGTLVNPKSAAGVRGTPVAALRARAQRGTPSTQIQAPSAAGVRGTPAGDIKKPIV